MSPAESRTEGMPSRIGPYRIVERLGGGGGGVVYRGHHFETGETAAVKTVPSQGNAAWLRHEMRTLSGLRHPGIARILTEGISDGVPWYAMELVRGRTLREHIRGAATTAERRALLSRVASLCGPLAFLHGRGVVHRDLKPSNVVLSDDGRPVIVDLGLTARFAGADGRDALEAGGLAVGSTAYMSPEQARGELLDARADLYALGCILYEVLTGEPPFGRDSTEVTYKHLHETPVAPSHLAPDVSPELDELVLRMLRKRREDRLGYVQDALAALRAAGIEPATATLEARTPPTYVYRPRFVGRAGPMRDLHARLVRAVRGSGGLVLVEGDGGAGKTRLATEVATAARSFRMRAVTGECAPLEASTKPHTSVPLRAFRPVWEAFADHLRALDDEAAGALLRRTRGGAGLLAAYEPALGGLAAGTEPLPTSPDGGRDRLLDGLVELIVAFGRERPLALVLDDLQHADELSIALLERLLDRGLTHDPVLVVATVRSDEPSAGARRLARHRSTERVALQPLDEQAVEVMVQDMLAVDELPGPLLRPIIERAGGNPFYVTEYVRSAVTGGVLCRDAAGRWQPCPCLQEPPMEPSGPAAADHDHASA